MKSKTSHTDQERMWAMYTHLSTLLGAFIPFANVVAPLIVWQTRKTDMPSLEAHAKRAINFQLSMLIYCAISFVLVFVIIGIFGLIALFIIDLIYTFKVAFAARDGKDEAYPLTIPFFS